MEMGTGRAGRACSWHTGPSQSVSQSDTTTQSVGGRSWTVVPWPRGLSVAHGLEGHGAHGARRVPGLFSILDTVKAHRNYSSGRLWPVSWLMERTGRNGLDRMSRMAQSVTMDKGCRMCRTGHVQVRGLADVPEWPCPRLCDAAYALVCSRTVQGRQRTVLTRWIALERTRLGSICARSHRPFRALACPGTVLPLGVQVRGVCRCATGIVARHACAPLSMFLACGGQDDDKAAPSTVAASPVALLASLLPYLCRSTMLQGSD